jgi:hypothetical protein
MPIHRGNDEIGSYYQYGNKHKYYYEIGNELSRRIALMKVKRQAQAIHANGYKKNN